MKKGLCILLLALMLATSTGCWNREEPKELASVNSILYDILDNGQYRVVLEIMNPTSYSGTGGTGENEKNPFTTVCGEGESIREAISNVSRSMEKTVFGGHNKVRFFTERFARQDMISVLELMARDRLMDETPLMIVIKDANPEDIHFSVIGLSDMVGNYLEDLAEQQKSQTAKSVSVTTLDFIKDYYVQGKQPIMGVAELFEEKSKSTENTGGEDSQQDSDSGSEGGDKAPRIILYEGLAVFKDNKLAGYMNGNEARAYNLVTETIESSFVAIPSTGKQTVVKIDDSKSDIDAFMEDDQPSFRVNIQAELSIAEESRNIDVSKPDPLKIIEEQFNETIRAEVKAAIYKAQVEFKSDIFGFGRQVQIQHPSQWPAFQENWDDHFSKAPIEVVVESSVYRSGQIKRPLTMED